ncbi:MAG: hypothetical protein AUK54_04335 [Helicobacteraceae bacterium CG2_30_36_10]|nr:MAG: hypothetical protein AUK54_04335 [Helicobacteraceae bacterium CG2_30_36_10]
MRVTKGGFTLIELMVSISILSIMMIFLYKSYASLNFSNEIIKTEVNTVTSAQELKKVIYLDFSLAMRNTTQIQNREEVEDFVFLQSSNSIHKRYNPYITYIVKEKKLYRLESLQRLDSYELAAESEFDADYLGEVKSFRVYKSSNAQSEIYLVHVDFANTEDILLKVKVLNE